jgi:hypothetical protein
MNTKELNRLLERYYSGESTVDEELILRDFFSGEDIPEGYEAEREIFAYYASAAEMPEPSADLEERIIAAAETEIRVRRPSVSRFLYPAIGIAASILVAAGAYLYFTPRETLRDTYSDPKTAYLETRRILYQVSSKMNHATLALEPVGKMSKAKDKSLSRISRSASVVEKSLKTLDKLKIRENESIRE